MRYEFPWKVRDKEAFERSVAATFPNGELLAKAVVEKFDADSAPWRTVSFQDFR
jgi:hypothetical protein